MSGRSGSGDDWPITWGPWTTVYYDDHWSSAGGVAIQEPGSTLAR